AMLALQREAQVVGVAGLARIAIDRPSEQALRLCEIAARADQHPERIPLRRLRRIVRDRLAEATLGGGKVAAVAAQFSEAPLQLRLRRERCLAALHGAHGPPEIAGRLPA